MSFYTMLQQDPAVLKAAIAAADTTREKRTLCLAMLVRPLLIVAFAMAMIAPLSQIFGSENSPFLVGLFCILLAVRFVDFGYCIRDSLINLAVVFALLLFAPVGAALLPPVPGMLLNFAAMLVIFVMTTVQPKMGNGGLYSFAYVFLAGSPVTGALLWKRALLVALGFLVCGIIFFCKHRTKHHDTSFLQILRSFRLSDARSCWQIRLALGTSLVLMVGQLLPMEHWIWAGFAGASLLSPYTSGNVGERFTQRIVGTAAGCTVFFLASLVIPLPVLALLGPVCGIVLGFCVDYRYKTAVNCCSALTMAVGVYGLPGAMFLRVCNNLLGVALAAGFALLYEWALNRCTVPERPEAQNS